MKYLPLFVLFVGCVSSLDTVNDITPIRVTVHMFSGQSKTAYIVAIDKRDVHVQLLVDSSFSIIRKPGARLIVPRTSIESITDSSGNDITDVVLNYDYELLAHRSLEKISEVQVKSYNFQVVLFGLLVTATILATLN